MPVPAPVLLVVSYYDARPQAELEALLHDLATLPAGAAFDVLVVVNQERATPTVVQTVLPGLRVLHRPNAGYNIGAWDHGWRHDPGRNAYLFLQHECRVRRAGWLAPFVRRLALPRVGLVGERSNPAWAAPWPELERRFAGHTLPDHRAGGAPADRLATYRDFFARNGIDPGPRGDHLQTLVLAATGALLARIGGFAIGGDYGEAIAAEIGISKRVQALGLTTEEVGPRPFTWITHPQWQDKPDQRAPAALQWPLPRWLERVRSERTFGDKPWLVLGKGPTFRLLDERHRAEHCLFALNHVVREVAVDVAHAIDVDAVRACRDILHTNCRFLLMPRVPHVDARPGDRLLEQWFDELPELYELERECRLVWYNCSTGHAQPGSPVIEVHTFSSEAAFGILAAMGVKRIRTLGVDGGRRYSAAFGDLDGTTRLQNGQPLFDVQFAHLRRIAGANGIDWQPLVPPLRLCILAAAGRSLAARVLEHSLRKHASMPLAIVHAAPGEPADGALELDACSLATGDAAGADGKLRERAAWLQPVDGEPWRHPDDPRAGPWLDAFAEAVHAGTVEPADVRRAVRRGEADARLLRPARLPLAAEAGAAGAVETKVRQLRRELAQLRLSRTWQLGRLLVRPALAAQRLLWRRVR